MTQHPQQTNHEPRKALPPPFQALNAPVPRCEAPECGELLHLVLPRSEIEFNARNVTVALVELMQMRSMPKGTDWFVVGANGTPAVFGGCIPKRHQTGKNNTNVTHNVGHNHPHSSTRQAETWRTFPPTDKGGET